MKIQIGKRAGRQAEQASSWWEQNRPAAPALFEQELEEALQLLLISPRAGVPYPTEKRPGLRRLLLPKTEYHVYFAIERNETVIAIQ